MLRAVSNGKIVAVFDSLYRKYGSFDKCASELKISYTEFYRCAKGIRRTISLPLLEKVCRLLNVLLSELNFSTIKSMETRFLFDIPIKDVLKNIDGKLVLDTENLLSDYLTTLKNCNGILKDLDYTITDDFIIIEYKAYSKRLNQPVKQTAKIPTQITVSDDMFYFLGIRFGDGTNGARFGLVNKDTNLIKFAFDFLQNYVDKSEIICQIMVYNKTVLKSIHKMVQNLKSLGLSNVEIFENYDAAGTFCYTVFVVNNFLAKIFDYLVNNIMSIWGGLTAAQRGSFIAGLFDADGNVNDWDKNLRISQLIKPKVDVIRHLLEAEGYNFRYDGASFVIGNKSETRPEDFARFETRVLPYMKSVAKIAKANNLLKGNLVRESFKEVVMIIGDRPGITQGGLKKLINKRPDRILRALLAEDYIRVADYPRRYFVKQKGVEWCENGKEGRTMMVPVRCF